MMVETKEVVRRFSYGSVFGDMEVRWRSGEELR